MVRSLLATWNSHNRTHGAVSWQRVASEACGFHFAGNMEQNKTCGSRRWLHGALGVIVSIGQL